MQDARAGIVTEEVKKAALREGMTPERMRAGIADGSIVIVRNTLRVIDPMAIGAGTRIKVNANIGTSSSKSDLCEELEKMRVAINTAPTRSWTSPPRATSPRYGSAS